MRTLIYFVRHAEAQSNVDPLFQNVINTLTDKGQKQALAVGNKFKDIPLEQVYTSKALRARLTCQEITRVVKKEVMELDFLKERKGAYSSSTEYYHLESFEDLLKRLDAAKTYFEHLASKKVAVVSHAIFLKSFAAYIMLGSTVNEERLLQVSDALVIDHGAISIFEYNHEKNRWHLFSLNDQSHLT